MARLKDWGNMLYGFFEDLFFAARLDIDFSESEKKRIIYEPLEDIGEKGKGYDANRVSLGKLFEGTYEEEKNDFFARYEAVQTFWENCKRNEKYADCFRNMQYEDKSVENDLEADFEDRLNESLTGGRVFEREMIWQDEMTGSVLPYRALKMPAELLRGREDAAAKILEREGLSADDNFCCIKEPKEIGWSELSFIEAEKENEDIYQKRNERKLEEQKRELILKSADAQKREAMADIKIEMVNTSESTHGIDIDETMEMLSERLCELMAKSADGLYL